MLTSDRKGAIAEHAITFAAIKLGIDVYRPTFEGGRYDLILDVGRLLRVQCKWAARQGDVLRVRCYSCRRSRTGMIRRCYTADEVDAIAAYSPDLDRCYLLPIEMCAGHTQIHLRLAPSRNN